MIRNALWTLGVLLLLAVPASGQETVEGFFEGTVDGFNSGTGAITLTGWALADSGIRQVIVQVDGVDIGRAVYGLFRPDVAAAFPGFPGSDSAGFGYNLNSTDYSNGLHQVSIKVVTNAGRTVVIDGTRQINFTNTTHLLVPFGAIDVPQRNAQLVGDCNRLPDQPGRLSVVEGWVLDLGVEIGDTGVSWVELMVDGAIVASTKVSCTFDPAAGGLTNCYGLPRSDIERLYPFALDAPNSGFRFALDVGRLIDLGFSRGHHVLTIRSGDISTREANVDEIPVTFFCSTDLGNESSFGRIESPRIGRAYAGDVLFQGWALDAEGVDHVNVLIDGEFIAHAEFGVGSRPSVASRYPGYPDTAAPVWRLLVDTTQLPDGFRQVEIRVVDDEDQVTGIGEVTFFVDNVRD